VFEGDVVYIKHLNPHDQVELEEIQQRYFDEAKARKVPTEEEMLELLKKDETWTEKDEELIMKGEDFVKRLQQGLTKIVLKKQIDHQTKLLEKEKSKIENKKQEKQNLLGNTCEKYAKERLNDYYMIVSFFKDKDLNEPLYSEEEFNYISVNQLQHIVSIYNEIFEGFSEEGIQHTVLDDFYSPYLGFADDSMQFFGIPFCQLTYNQIRLIVYTRVFRNIFEQNQNIPEQIKKDPQKLLDYGSISREERDSMKEKLSHGDGSTLVGATKEDYEYLGVEERVGGVDLAEEVRKKGGTLNMEDLMKLHGVG
jgi:hypothetical protein